jgi:hypothetical protein
MEHIERAELLPARDTLGFVFIKNLAVFGQNQTNIAANGFGAYGNTAIAGGSQSVTLFQFSGYVTRVD